MLKKILFAGSAGAGKTTAIETISDEPVTQTEAAASDSSARGKSNTTVAMDYGRIRIDGSLELQLIGTPGQTRFDFMWDILARGAIGMVLLIDNSADEPISELEFYLDAFGALVKEKHEYMVVGVTHRDVRAYPAMSDYRECLAARGLMAPVYEIDARAKHDIRIALLTLMTMLNPKGHRNVAQ